jgi:hypothetical protein
MINMVHKIKTNEKGQVEWGFDLTEVESDEAFLSLLKEFGFSKVHSEKPSDKHYPDSVYSNDGGMKGRFTSFYDTFENPAGIRIRVEHMGGKGGDKGFLGYIGIEAPKSANAQLQNFLKRFRGAKQIKSLDWNGRKGIARYVKEEDAYESNYIGVR